MNVRDIRLNAARLRTWDEVLDAARAVSHSIVFIRSANAVRSTSSWSSNLKLKYAYCNECEDEISPIIESLKQSNSVHLSVSFYVKVSPTPAFLLDFSGSKTRPETTVFERWNVLLELMSREDEKDDEVEPSREVENVLAEVYRRANSHSDHVPLNTEYRFAITASKGVGTSSDSRSRDSRSRDSRSRDWIQRSNSMNSTSTGRLILKTLNIPL